MALFSSSPRPVHVLLSLLFAVSCLQVHAQPSTNMPVPPLQWIELTDLLSASPQPHLKDASIGYDGDGTLLIFGGESSAGFPTSSTYKIDLKGLQWSTFSAPDGLTQSPSERSAVLGGDDSAASYRHGHVVAFGNGSDDTAATDVWEFDYTSTFWSQASIKGSTKPSARWGAAGGIDPRVTTSDLTSNFYMAGGYNGKTIFDLTEVWQMNVAGVLSSNLPNEVTASWTQVTISGDSIPGRVGMGGAVIQQKIVAVGGCTSASSLQAIEDSSCAVQDAQIIDASTSKTKTLTPCLSPRIDPVVVPNMNSASSSFNNQVFILLGTFNNTMWNDGSGLQDGEVGVLDVGTGDWARVLPAGDPNTSSGKPKFPVPRQGAAALAWTGPLVGGSSVNATDTIVFGGRDVNGSYLSDVWLLRSYNAALTASNQKWTGFGSGALTTGVAADGQGVSVQYMTECAVQLSSPTTPTTTTSGSSPTTSGTSPGVTEQPTSSTTVVYYVSMVHKFLPPASLALFLPAIALYRISAPSAGQPHLMERNMGVMYLGITIGVAAYAIGIVGLVTAFTSISSTTTLTKRSSSPSVHLQTSHAIAGLALFAALYFLVPLLQLLVVCTRRFSSKNTDLGDGKMRSESVMEKMSMNGTGRAMSPSGRSARTSQDGEGKKRIRSWAGIGTWAGISGRRSNETTTDDQAHTPSHRSFEVVNRPMRQRRASANSLAAFSDPRPTHTPRNLSDMSWLDTRRSTSRMGAESNPGLSPVDRRDAPWTPGTTPMEITSTNGLMLGQQGFEPPILPSPFEGLVHVVFHFLLLALTVVSLIALFQRGPIAAFAVFLAWTVAFYGILIGLSWNGRPRKSILSVFFSRLRAEPARFSPVPRAGSPAGSRPLSMNDSVAVPFPTDGRGPYHHHQPPYRTAGVDHEYPPLSTTVHGHEHDADVDYEDDEDEDARQRRIEEELSRRDVSIVTVPKRRLYLLNPNPPEHDDEAHGH